MAKKKIEITLVRSPLACKPNHRRTVKALGLRKIGQSVTHDDTDVIRGMINTVNYLINVEES
ncbi:MAG: 50S ribosomal protein L30 [Dethiobacteria bacterium]|nr:50S ribosomal protein L30 [Bacillota bacterium]MDW7729445.1 50S ribosomal protein L30 [Bacillota bacterium]